MLDLIIKNAKVCTSSDIFLCDIGIQNKQIVLLEKSINQKSKETLDANGKYVLPGGIDGHCHLDQPMKDGSVIADNFESGTKSAAIGGTTTVIPFAVQYKGDNLRKVIQGAYGKAGLEQRIEKLQSLGVRPSKPIEKTTSVQDEIMSFDTIEEKNKSKETDKKIYS